MSRIPDQTLTTHPHPSWCDPSRCRDDRAGDVLHDRYHRSESATFTGPDPIDPDACRLTATASLISVEPIDSGDDPSAPTVDLTVDTADAVFDVGAVEALGHWLVSQAARARVAIGGESTPDRIVLDAALDLAVETADADDCVVLTAPPTVDGEWWFSPREARALAAALLTHACALDALDADGAR
jgi:hypothetical protein